MGLLKSPLAPEGLGHEALSDEVSYGQGHVEGLCCPEDTFDFWAFENALVEEQDRHLGDR